ncbi:rhamnogalacturonan acetylesterase [Rufibacter tibetensis]|uniref:GDSL family lipase n=1 Tax=Rufibacter tibetensis TaxID=512763 RepID=A0A0P0CFQ8_9BACT|nr:rhamnogalacturonan acetylesterase [Rufibacter tibetensis]ALI97830.1 GDSL family lipase [Rufibacter tibetensis]
MQQKNLLTALLLFVLAGGFLASFTQKTKPTLYIIGDSTVRNTNEGYGGWGTYIAELFDTTKISVSNQAMAGRSTRTFIKEKRWDKVMSTLKPGDFVIMQFGHNEGSVPDTSKAGYRGVLRGTGDETKELTWKDGEKEVVQTYGWYLRKFVREAKEKGATPIIASMIPRNQWKDAKVPRANKDFGKWAKETAQAENILFIDLNEITAQKYEKMGPEQVKTLFPTDHTHTNPEGARINAASVVEGLKMNKKHPLNKYLKKKKS